MVMTSLMINSEREAVVDFTVPFMETGIAILHLEDYQFCYNRGAKLFFLFYFQNPLTPPLGCWWVLFMTNVWAMFAVVFLAIYTANLAAFMITREEFHEFSGLDDPRLSKPFSHKPMYKFGTIPWSHTDSTLSKYFAPMHAYMKNQNRSTVTEGIEAVLSGELDAFIYDGTVLDFLVAQDEDCRLLTVGDLERLRRYWMTGTCKPGKQEHKSSDPLALEQFLSAFLLLMSGILLAAVLLALEHVYFKYAQDILRHHRCRDPICDTHLWKVKHELDLARMKIRQLQKELEAHGIKPSRRLLNADDVLKPRDMTRNHVSSTEFSGRFQGGGQLYRPCRTEIAEMETVL
ncbi:hypothetical protein C0J52_20570 [Blattella germanica]|nr:hypothetical protein C0J52_20570 [Blattella germanica]